MSYQEDRRAGLKRVQAWTQKVRPIIASRRPHSEKVEALVAAGCTEKNASSLARMSVRKFDITNNSTSLDRTITQLEGGA